MSSDVSPLPRAEREARRAVLQDALADLVEERKDPQAAAGDVLRALDSYMESYTPVVHGGPREPPVTDFARPGGQEREVRWTMWVVLGGALVSTIIVAILLAGGWPAGLAILGIWLVALLVLVST